MAKQKSSINWYFLLIGIIMLYLSLPDSNTSQQPELKKITVELFKDITTVKGSRSSVDYKLWTKNYNNQFNILNGSVTRGKNEAIENLKAGQIVDLLISSSSFENLSKGEEGITIRGISLNGNTLMAPEEFYQNRKVYKTRLTVFSLFTGLMLILHGLMKVPKKINYIIIGTFVGAIVIMRIFDVGIY
ncbi:hypothetical protein ACFFLS_18570 [Flavobacterium procerum]|uniref:Uncharacterized protein n=1 Tax=Flavobacterium procerum TaxID=1455569 RepID=A0ABV6BUD5_9FLAO